MINFIKKLFAQKQDKAQLAQINFTQEEYENDYKLKSKGLKHILGPMDDMVGHAIIPFAIGGAVDMYYFPNGIEGTGFATMELLEPDGTGPLPNRLGTYELTAFTKKKYDTSDDAKSAFNLIERDICGIFTKIGFFSREAILNPNETCELPNGEGEENTCVVFDLYEPDGKQFKVGNRLHHLLLCLQVYRTEMDFARANGSQALLTKLKEAGCYPYSDLDRPATV